MNTLSQENLHTHKKEHPLSQFELAAGSVPGRRHLGSGNLLSGKNNQDAMGFLASHECVILSVHDGCGSTPHSEFGARIGATLLPIVIADELRNHGADKVESNSFWESVKVQLLERIESIISLCHPGEMDSETRRNFARSHFLFTVLGALLTEKLTIVFGIGDGAFAINGKLKTIGPFPDNAPDYLCRSLGSRAEAPEFVVHAKIRTELLETLVIGTDGMQDLVNAAPKRIPGKARIVGDIHQLFSQEFLFRSIETDTVNDSPPLDSLTGWLRQINSEVTRLSFDEDQNPIIKREEGLLPDDTTLMALKRSQQLKTVTPNS
jgi:hypothetical protein